MKKADEFVSNRELVDRLKDITCKHISGRKVKDKDVCELLNISSFTISTAIKRDSESFKIIVLKMCARTGLDPMKILF